MIFRLNEKEEKAAIEFFSKHKEKSPGHGYKGAIGGGWYYTFMPTSLGRVVIVKCECGVEENITDFDDW